jgi:hypothetical protein
MAAGACAAILCVVTRLRNRKILENDECDRDLDGSGWSLGEFRVETPGQPQSRAVRLPEEKYCSVAAMLNKTAKISWKIELDEK